MFKTSHVSIENDKQWAKTKKIFAKWVFIHSVATAPSSRVGESGQHRRIPVRYLQEEFLSVCFTHPWCKRCRDWQLWNCIPRKHFIFTCSDTFAVWCIVLATVHSITERRTERPTDGQYHANSRSYCMQYDRQKINRNWARRKFYIWSLYIASANTSS